MKTLTVPTASLKSLEHAFGKIVKAARRLGLSLSDTGLRVLPDTKRELLKTRVAIEQANSELGSVGGERTEKFAVEVVDVEISLPSTGATTGEWIVVGRVNKVVDAPQGGNDVFSQQQEIVEAFRTAPITCEHCKANRHRVRSVVCANVVKGELKQVGHECATFYVGNAEQAIDELAFVEFVQVLLAPFSDEDGPEWGGRGGRVALAHDAQEVVARAARLIRVDGWTASKDDNGNPNHDATWRRVAGELTRKVGDPLFVYVSEEDNALAVLILRWVEENIDSTDDEYLQAIQALFQPGWVSSRRLGLAVSVVRAYERVQDGAFKKANPPTEAAPQGRVQVTGKILKFKSVPGFTYDSWVTKTIVELTSRARVYVSLPSFLPDAKVGDTITFVATFERSKDDQFFAFGSRPAAPKVKKPKAKKGEKVVDPLAPGGQYVAK